MLSISDKSTCHPESVSESIQNILVKFGTSTCFDSRAQAIENVFEGIIFSTTAETVSTEASTQNEYNFLVSFNTRCFSSKTVALCASNNLHHLWYKGILSLCGHKQHIEELEIHPLFIMPTNVQSLSVFVRLSALFSCFQPRVHWRVLDEEQTLFEDGLDRTIFLTTFPITPYFEKSFYK